MKHKFFNVNHYLPSDADLRTFRISPEAFPPLTRQLMADVLERDPKLQKLADYLAALRETRKPFPCASLTSSEQPGATARLAPGQIWIATDYCVNLKKPDEIWLRGNKHRRADEYDPLLLRLCRVVKHPEIAPLRLVEAQLLSFTDKFYHRQYIPFYRLANSMELGFYSELYLPEPLTTWLRSDCLAQHLGDVNEKHLIPKGQCLVVGGDKHNQLDYCEYLRTQTRYLREGVKGLVKHQVAKKPKSVKTVSGRIYITD